MRAEVRSAELIIAHDLIYMLATIYRDISDEDLMAYADFANSDVGKRYFEGLLEATRVGIGGGVGGMRRERTI